MLNCRLEPSNSYLVEFTLIFCQGTNQIRRTFSLLDFPMNIFLHHSLRPHHLAMVSFESDVMVVVESTCWLLAANAEGSAQVVARVEWLKVQRCWWMR